MKILVVSDSHGRLDYLMQMWEKETPDMVISAGDYSKDVEELSYIYESSKYHIVRGNCDYMDHSNEDILEIEVENKNIFLTHGHLFSVKSGYNHIRLEAIKRQVDICIFGHTHIVYKESLKKEGIELFNPGAVQDKCYGVIEINDNKIKINHKKL